MTDLTKGKTHARNAGKGLVGTLSESV
jgi:hypothetical protein